MPPTNSKHVALVADLTWSLVADVPRKGGSLVAELNERVSLVTQLLKHLHIWLLATEENKS